MKLQIIIAPALAAFSIQAALAGQISPDGMGEFYTPDGDCVSSDGMGGFYTP